MNKIAIVDISGTVDEYSLYLSHSLVKKAGSEFKVYLFCQTSLSDKSINLIKLHSFIPVKYKRSLSKIKRSIKAIESLFNYLRVFVYLLYGRFKIVHFQWFPFLNVISVEKYLLKLLKFLKPKLKIVYTVHNVYPHDISDTKKAKYRKRFIELLPLLDKIVVHTNSTMSEIEHEFNVRSEKIEVHYHGIFYPLDYRYLENYSNNTVTRILMYGIQQEYKGTDILVKAIDNLPDKIKTRIEVLIVGRTEPSFYNDLLPIIQRCPIKWITYRVSNKDLYDYISNADLLVYPFRKISQSGSLLLGLYFKKYIIASNLPSFVETLDGFDKSWFCNAGDVNNLSLLLSQHVESKIDRDAMKDCISNLNIKYNWDTIAKGYLDFYSKLINY